MMAHSQKDAFAKVCLHAGLEAERLDPDEKEKKAKRISVDDVEKYVNDLAAKADTGEQTVSADEAKRLSEALNKLKALQQKKK